MPQLWLRTRMLQPISKKLTTKWSYFNSLACVKSYIWFMTIPRVSTLNTSWLRRLHTINRHWLGWAGQNTVHTRNRQKHYTTESTLLQVLIPWCELERDTIHTVSLIGGCRETFSFENMAEMSPTSRTSDFDSSPIWIRLEFNHAQKRIVSTV